MSDNLHAGRHRAVPYWDVHNTDDEVGLPCKVVDDGEPISCCNFKGCVSHQRFLPTTCGWKVCKRYRGIGRILLA